MDTLIRFFEINCRQEINNPFQGVQSQDEIQNVFSTEIVKLVGGERVHYEEVFNMVDYDKYDKTKVVLHALDALVVAIGSKFIDLNHKDNLMLRQVIAFLAVKYPQDRDLLNDLLYFRQANGSSIEQISDEYKKTYRYIYLVSPQTYKSTEEFEVKKGRFTYISFVNRPFSGKPTIYSLLCGKEMLLPSISGSHDVSVNNIKCFKEAFLNGTILNPILHYWNQPAQDLQSFAQMVTDSIEVKNQQTFFDKLSNGLNLDCQFIDKLVEVLGYQTLENLEKLELPEELLDLMGLEVEQKRLHH